MKSIRKWRNLFALIFVVNTLLTVWFTVKQVPELAIVFGIISVAMLICLIMQNSRLYDARLICDNRILSVPSVVITPSCRTNKKIVEETVVSTFGVLLGSKVYKWGCDEVTGSRLSNIEINRERIRLTFGTGDEEICIELLHGITNKQTVMEINQKLWHETGVRASINGWS